MTATLDRVLPNCRKTYIDDFASTDLRFAHNGSGIVDTHGKKSLFRDCGRLLRPTSGDTHLAECFSRH